MSLVSPLRPVAVDRLDRARVRTLVALAAALVLVGCSSIAPKPLQSSDVTSQAAADRTAAQRDVAPITGPLTLQEALARGLKYNLDRRTRMMEEAIAFDQFDLGRYDLLPKMVAAAGYHERSEFATTRAVDSVTGQPSLANPFISSDKDHATTDLGLTWSLLDFGLSYYGAKQNADRALIAVERRRKAMHTLIQDVRTAFWRTASAQKLRSDVAAAIEGGTQALGDARQAEQERLRSPLDALRYQRQILENLRLLEAIDQELSTAKVELASLINAPLGTDLQVVEPTDTPDARLLALPLDRLEAVAIEHNADLREQFYNGRIAVEETHKTLLKLFPNLNLSASIRHDSDRYLVHNNWNEAGVQLSFNLLGLLSAPQQMRLADAGVALADQRRVATQMAILAQVHIARLQYANALQQYQRSDAISQVDARINGIVGNREQSAAGSRLDRVASHTAAILSLLRRYQALALTHAAASRLQATLGMEPDLGGVQDMSLADLTRAVAQSLQRWDDGLLPDAAIASAASVAP